MGGNVSGYHYVGIKMEGFGQRLILSCPFMKSTTDIFFIGMSTADDVSFGGRDNGHIAHCDLGRKCQSGRTSSLFSFEFSLPQKYERTGAL